MTEHLTKEFTGDDFLRLKSEVALFVDEVCERGGVFLSARSKRLEDGMLRSITIKYREGTET